MPPPPAHVHASAWCCSCGWHALTICLEEPPAGLAPANACLLHLRMCMPLLGMFMWLACSHISRVLEESPAGLPQHACLLHLHMCMPLLGAVHEANMLWIVCVSV